MFWSGVKGSAEDRARRGLWLAVAGASVCLVLLREIDLLLKSIQALGEQAYGTSVVTRFRFNPTAVTDEVASALTIWGRANPDGLGRELLAWHLGIDTVFIVAYASVLFVVLMKLGAEAQVAKWTVGVLAGVDLLENLLILVLVWLPFAHDWLPSWLRWLPDEPIALWVVPFASDFKWLALIVVVIHAGACWRDNGGVSRRGASAALHRHLLTDKDEVSPRALNDDVVSARPFFRLFPQLVLVAAFGAIVALPGGSALDQFPDVLRASLEDHGGPLVLSMVALVLFATCVVIGGRRSTLLDDMSPGQRERGRSSRGLLLFAAGLGVVLAMFAVPLGGPTLAMFAGPLLLVGVVLAGWALPRMRGGTSRRSTAAAEVPTESAASTIQHWVAALAGAILLIGAVGVVRATARPVLIEQDMWGWMVAAIVIALVASTLVHELLVLPNPGQCPGWLKWTYRTVAIACAVVVVVTVVVLSWRPDFAPRLGTIGVVAMTAAALALALGEVVRWSELHEPWVPIQQLLVGIRRTPYITLIMATGLLAAGLDRDGGYHDVPLTSGDQLRHIGLESGFREWAENTDECPTREESVGEPAATSDEPQPSTSETRPMLFVAAPGGGIRAAHWTAAGLDKLSGQCAGAAIFAVSSVSGGSLGTMAWMYPRSDDDIDTSGSSATAELSSDDALATAAAGLLLRDWPHTFVPFKDGAGGRSTLLADAWSERLEQMTDKDGGHDVYIDGAEFSDLTTTGAWDPVLVFNGASVADGCRVLTSNTGLLEADGDFCLDVPGAGAQGVVSGAENSREFAITDGKPGLGHDCLSPDEPADAETPQATELAGMQATMAALMSARFPLITPSGTLRRCVGSQVKPTYVVDGGYIENSGLLTLLQMWEKLEPAVRTYNEDTANRVKIVPWIVVIDNHYRSLARGPAVKRVAESLLPLVAVRNARSTYGPVALEQIATREMQSVDAADRCANPDRVVVLDPDMAPTVTAPLGWVLSKNTRDELTDQLTEQWNKPDPELDGLQNALSGTCAAIDQ